jgi:hypothetical protein
MLPADCPPGSFVDPSQRNDLLGLSIVSPISPARFGVATDGNERIGISYFGREQLGTQTTSGSTLSRSDLCR